MDESARARLLNDCLPLSAYQAQRQGLVDYLSPEGIAGPDLSRWIVEFAARRRQLSTQDDLRHWRPLPSEADLAATQDQELRTIDQDFARPEFQTALESFVLKHPGEPPAAATEHRGAYDSTPLPDRVGTTGGDARRRWPARSHSQASNRSLPTVQRSRVLRTVPDLDGARVPALAQVRRDRATGADARALMWDPAFEPQVARRGRAHRTPGDGDWTPPGKPQHHPCGWRR